MKSNPNRACLKRSTKPAARQVKQTLKQTLRLHLRTRSLPSGGCSYKLVDVRTGQVVLLLVMERELPSLLKMAERRLKSLTGPLMDALILHYPRMESEIKGQGRAAA